MWNEEYFFNLATQYLPPEAKICTDYTTGKPSIYIGDLDEDSIPEIQVNYFEKGKKEKLILKNFFGSWYVVSTENGIPSMDRDLIDANIDHNISYFHKTGSTDLQPKTIIDLSEQYKIIEKKYNPNKNYLVYYPMVLGIRNSILQMRINNKLKVLSKVKPVKKGPLDYYYSGDFSIEYFKDDLLVLKLFGYNYPFGAAHGMPSETHSHINLNRGRLYELKDLFKPGSDYINIISEIIQREIKCNPEYSYVFPEEFKNIKKDQSFFVNDDTLNIYCDPYEIAPYAAGFPTFSICFNEIMSIINTKGTFCKAFHQNYKAQA